MVAVARDKRIGHEGLTSEAEWSDWLVALAPTALALGDLLQAAQRLVVVAPHPDDEVLACGGLVALHAQQGGPVLTLAVSDGEASHQGDPAWSAPALAVARRLERARGLARLGLAAESVVRLALPDGALGRHRAALALGLRAVLRRTDCVVVTWRLDGHPDHEAVGATTARVCAEIGCRLIEAPVWMWHWSSPADPRVPWQRLHSLPLPATTRARRAAALAEHATQLLPRTHQPPVLGATICARAARDAEYFLV